MAVQMPPASPVPLARQAREQFVAYVEGVLQPLSDAIRIKLIELVDTGTSTRDMQDRRDAMLEFERQRARWVQGTAKGWHDAIIPPTTTARPEPPVRARVPAARWVNSLTVLSATTRTPSY